MRKLIALAAALAAGLLLNQLSVPGAWFFAPLLVTMLFAVRGGDLLRIPRPGYVAAQAVIGSTLGASASSVGFNPHYAGTIAVAVGTILLTSLLNGWLLTKITSLEPIARVAGSDARALAVCASSAGLRDDGNTDRQPFRAIDDPSLAWAVFPSGWNDRAATQRILGIDEITITGQCPKVEILGHDNKISLEAVGDIQAAGHNNLVTYRSGLNGEKPKIGMIGHDNKIAAAE